KNSYNKLSANQKKVLDDHCTGEWAQKFMAAWNKQEADGRGELAAKPGHSVYPLNEKFLGELRAASAPVKKEWEDSVRKAGEDPDKLWNGLVEAMKKYKAQS